MGMTRRIEGRLLTVSGEPTGGRRDGSGRGGHRCRLHRRGVRLGVSGARAGNADHGGGAGTGRGRCSYYACMPTKGLLRPLEAVHAARRVPGAAEAVTGDVDAGRVFLAPRPDHRQPRRLRPGGMAGREGRRAGSWTGPGGRAGAGRGCRPAAGLRPPGGGHRVGAGDPTAPRPGGCRVLDESRGLPGEGDPREHRHRRRGAGGLRVRPAVLPDGGEGCTDRRRAAPALTRRRGGRAAARRDAGGGGRGAAPGRRYHPGRCRCRGDA